MKHYEVGETVAQRRFNSECPFSMFVLCGILPKVIRLPDRSLKTLTARGRLVSCTETEALWYECMVASFRES